MLDNCYALFFSADIVAALAETPDIERASDEELIEMAQKQGIDLRKCLNYVKHIAICWKAVGNYSPTVFFCVKFLLT